MRPYPIYLTNIAKYQFFYIYFYFNFYFNFYFFCDFFMFKVFNAINFTNINKKKNIFFFVKKNKSINKIFFNSSNFFSKSFFFLKIKKKNKKNFFFTPQLKNSLSIFFSPIFFFKLLFFFKKNLIFFTGLSFFKNYYKFSSLKKIPFQQNFIQKKKKKFWKIKKIFYFLKNKYASKRSYLLFKKFSFLFFIFKNELFRKDKTYNLKIKNLTGDLKKIDAIFFFSPIKYFFLKKNITQKLFKNLNKKKTKKNFKKKIKKIFWNDRRLFLINKKKTFFFSKKNKNKSLNLNYLKTNNFYYKKNLFNFEQFTPNLFNFYFFNEILLKKKNKKLLKLNFKLKKRKKKMIFFLKLKKKNFFLKKNIKINFFKKNNFLLNKGLYFFKKQINRFFFKLNFFSVKKQKQKFFFSRFNKTFKNLNLKKKKKLKKISFLFRKNYFKHRLNFNRVYKKFFFARSFFLKKKIKFLFYNTLIKNIFIKKKFLTKKKKKIYFKKYFSIKNNKDNSFFFKKNQKIILLNFFLKKKINLFFFNKSKYTDKNYTTALYLQMLPTLSTLNSKVKFLFNHSLSGFIYLDSLSNLLSYKKINIWQIRKMIYSFTSRNDLQNFILKKYIKTYYNSISEKIDHDSDRLAGLEPYPFKALLFDSIEIDSKPSDYFYENNRFFFNFPYTKSYTNIFFNRSNFLSSHFSLFSANLSSIDWEDDILETSYIKAFDDFNYSFSIRKTKFKPGYSTMWRDYRLTLKTLLNLKFQYQHQLTKYLSKLTKMIRHKLYFFFEMQLDNILTLSKIFPDRNWSIFFINEGLIFINGSKILNIFEQLFKNDFVQLVVSIKYYILYRWLVQWQFFKKHKLKNRLTKKLNNKGLPDDKQKSKNLPLWILKNKNTNEDVIKYIEVDYFSLSFFILYEPLFFTEINALSFLSTRYNIINLFNWKYIN